MLVLATLKKSRPKQTSVGNESLTSGLAHLQFSWEKDLHEVEISAHHLLIKTVRDSLAVQRLGLRTLTAEGPGSVPGQGTKIPQTAQQKKQNKKQNKQTQTLQCLPLLA